MKNHDQEEYWFPAKRYGWGWGPPNTWKGWVVLLGYFVSISATGFVFKPNRYPIVFPVVIFVLTAVLITICFLKGEPPGWRWGGDDNLPLERHRPHLKTSLTWHI